MPLCCMVIRQRPTVATCSLDGCVEVVLRLTCPVPVTVVLLRDQASYRIGPYSYSLNDMENGILRCNRKSPGQFMKYVWRSVCDFFLLLPSFFHDLTRDCLKPHQVLWRKGSAEIGVTSSRRSPHPLCVGVWREVVPLPVRVSPS
jgi:hypothetical protein